MRGNRGILQRHHPVSLVETLCKINTEPFHSQEINLDQPSTLLWLYYFTSIMCVHMRVCVYVASCGCTTYVVLLTMTTMKKPHGNSYLFPLPPWKAGDVNLPAICHFKWVTSMEAHSPYGFVHVAWFLLRLIHSFMCISNLFFLMSRIPFYI